MIRKLFFATLGAALLGGCVTGYQYRGGSGDYYYGQPSVDYYDDGYYDSYGSPYGYGGYPGGWNGMLGIGLGYGGYYGPYGYPYGYGDPYGYGHHHRRPVIVVPDPPPDPRSGYPHRDDHDRHDRFIMRRPLPGAAPRAVPDPAVAMPVIAAPARAPTFAGGRDLESIPVPVPRVERSQRAPARADARGSRDTFRRERDDGLKPRP